jgi:hypothetical protein
MSIAGAAAQQMGRRQAQAVSSAANARIIAQLGYKLAVAFAQSLGRINLKDNG